METVCSIELNQITREELLPGFEPDFPYIASRAEMDRYPVPTVPWHWHKAVELFYIHSGTLEYTTPNTKHILPQGSGGFCNSNVLHTSRVVPTGRENVQFIHLFDPSLLGGEPGSRMEERYILPLTTAPGVEMIPLFPENEAHAPILGAIRDAFDIDPGSFGCEFRLREALTNIWMQLLKLARPQPGTAASGSELVKALMVYIHEHYAEPISVEDLARAAHISKRLCFRLFREQLHMTPVEYMRSYRLQLACRLLASTDSPITAIASACGLGSSSYFGKLFREQFGCSPAQYRRRMHERETILR